MVRPMTVGRIAANAATAEAMVGSERAGVFASQLNLVPCFKPEASPESNGMSEDLVKILKRDYLHVGSVPDAATALDQIVGWFVDYNENYPHSGYKFARPRVETRHQLAEVSGETGQHQLATRFNRLPATIMVRANCSCCSPNRELLLIRPDTA